jgi:hypothetical protein
MTYCTNCGANVPNDKKFCGECGTPVDVSAAVPQEPEKAETLHMSAIPEQAAPPKAAHVVSEQAAPLVAAPVAPVHTAPPVTQTAQSGISEPPKGSPYAVMSMGAYIGSAILMSIPVIGWLIGIIWACGGCKNLNKRNYARSYLVFLVIAAVLGVAGYFVIDWLLSGLLDTLRQYT